MKKHLPSSDYKFFLRTDGAIGKLKWVKKIILRKGTSPANEFYYINEEIIRKCRNKKKITLKKNIYKYNWWVSPKSLK